MRGQFKYKGQLFNVQSKEGQAVGIDKFLPHGSGIDLQWETGTNGKNLYAFNAFHCMSDNGMYDGWARFYLVIPLNSTNLADDFKLHFEGQDSQYMNQKHMLRDYLEDTFHYALSRIASIITPTTEK